jgi:hypothetical protein
MMRQTFIAAAMFAQIGAGSTGGTAPVSPSVIATDMCVIDAEGRGTLELLILWRGSPGWFRKGSGDASGNGGQGGSMGGGPGPTIRSEWISQGGVNLTARFDPAARKAWIQDKEVLLGDANVVLVDGVDTAEGPLVVQTLRIDPEYETTVDLLPGGPVGRGPRTRPRAVPVQTFIRRSPELVEFLQCDTRLPDASAYEQQVFDMWCSWVKQP